mmetsp:Transcript_10769/g.19962  ORF Transcript_10769/g.19962 Transcript_10769/m.19962 type:complete len:224 (-) Transcript_10769:1489-2160(-)
MTSTCSSLCQVESTPQSQLDQVSVLILQRTSRCRRVVYEFMTWSHASGMSTQTHSDPRSGWSFRQCAKSSLSAHPSTKSWPLTPPIQLSRCQCSGLRAAFQSPSATQRHSSETTTRQIFNRANASSQYLLTLAKSEEISFTSTTPQTCLPGSTFRRFTLIGSMTIPAWVRWWQAQTANGSLSRGIVLRYTAAAVNKATESASTSWIWRTLLVALHHQFWEFSI